MLKKRENPLNFEIDTLKIEELSPKKNLKIEKKIKEIKDYSVVGFDVNPNIMFFNSSDSIFGYDFLNEQKISEIFIEKNCRNFSLSPDKNFLSYSNDKDIFIVDLNNAK